MKNWKCIIGATVGTPLIIAAMFGALLGALWIEDKFPILKMTRNMEITIAYAGGVFILVAIWATLYLSRADHHKSKEIKEDEKGTP